MKLRAPSAAILALFLLSPAASDARPQRGDVVLLLHDFVNGEVSVRRIDPATGGVETVSGNRLPTRIARAGDGSLVGVDLYPAVVRLALEAGTIETVSAAQRGDGPLAGIGAAARWLTPDVDVADDGTIWLSTGCCVLRVDPATGDRTDATAGLDVAPIWLAFEPAGTMVLSYFYSSPGCTPGGGEAYAEGLQRLDLDGPVSLSTLLPIVWGCNFEPYALSDIAVTPDGRIFVSTRDGSVLRLEAAALTNISGHGAGAGPAFGEPTRLFAASDDELLAFDDATGAIVAVDPTTGDRTTVSGAGVGEGPSLTDLIGVEPGGPLFARASDGIVRVERPSGDRTLVFEGVVGAGPALDWSRLLAADTRFLFGKSGSSLLVIDAATGDRVAAPEAAVPVAVADRLEPDGRRVVLSILEPSAQASVLRIDFATGAADTLSGPDAGSGPLWANANDVEVGADGIYVLDADAVLRVDPETGERSIVSDPLTGSGESFGMPVALAIAPDGTLYVSGGIKPGVFRIDPASGDRTRVTPAEVPGWLIVDGLAADLAGHLLVLVRVMGPLSTLYAVDPAVGTPEPIATANILAVAVVPEPASLALACAALGSLAGARAARRGPKPRRPVPRSR